MREEADNAAPASTGDEATGRQVVGLAGVVIWWAPVLGWMGVIFYMSSKGGPSVWNPLTYVAHFLEYLILGILLCAALDRTTPLSRRALLICAVAVASLYGLSDELHQGFVPTREVSVWDWLTDTAGATTALLVWVRMTRTWRSSQVT